MTAAQLSLPEQAASLPPFFGASLTPRRLRALLIGLGLATGMEVYTIDSLNLVLADLTGSLAVSGGGASWTLTVNGSALFLAVQLSIWGAGHFGCKRFLLATAAAFAVASIGCAVAPDLRSKLLWLASVYALMPPLPCSPSLMNNSTTRYLSSAANLLLSGQLTHHLHWRFIFFPSVLYAMGAIWLLMRHSPDIPIGPSPRLGKTDWPGSGPLAIALVCREGRTREAEVLSYADGLAFMAIVGTIALSLVLITPHTPATKK